MGSKKKKTMKKTNLLLLSLFSLIIIASSCTKKVDEKGLTKKINKILPDTILTKMVEAGMPIHGGNTPPKIEGTFFASPMDLVSSSVPDDPETHTFADLTITFKNFKKRKLTLELDYVNGLTEAEGLATYIVGEGNKFSMFCKIKARQLILFRADVIMVISGTLTDNGIEDFYTANFMIDNHGNTVPLGLIDDDLGVWIPNGTGRVVKDGDGFTERTGEAKSKSNSSNNTNTCLTAIE